MSTYDHISLISSYNEKCFRRLLETIKTHILFSITFSLKSCRLWDNVGKYGTAIQTTEGNRICSMRFACWIPNVTDTCREYVIGISFLQQQWLYERASMLRYTYTACLLAILFWEVSASVISYLPSLSNCLLHL